MIYAYDKVYLDKARSALGRMLDFAVYDLRRDLGEFFSIFISSGVAERFERGDVSLLVGMSGVELAYEVLDSAGLEYERAEPRYTANRSAEYWLGWALAYYQWETSLAFEDIVRAVPIEHALALYEPYHEMDIRQFCDKMTELLREAMPETNLKRRRQLLGLSQRELAEMSNVPLRTIQQYEQRQKNINKAQAEYLVKLSRVLVCHVEDLLEKTLRD